MPHHNHKCSYYPKFLLLANIHRLQVSSFAHILVCICADYADAYFGLGSVYYEKVCVHVCDVCAYPALLVAIVSPHTSLIACMSNSMHILQSCIHTTFAHTHTWQSFWKTLTGRCVCIPRVIRTTHAAVEVYVRNHEHVRSRTLASTMNMMQMGNRALTLDICNVPMYRAVSGRCATSRARQWWCEASCQSTWIGHQVGTKTFCSVQPAGKRLQWAPFSISWIIFWYLHIQYSHEHMQAKRLWQIWVTWDFASYLGLVCTWIALYLGLLCTWDCFVLGIALYLGLLCTWDCFLLGIALYESTDLLNTVHTFIVNMKYICKYAKVNVVSCLSYVVHALAVAQGRLEHALEAYKSVVRLSPRWVRLSPHVQVCMHQHHQKHFLGCISCLMIQLDNFM